MPFCVVRGRFSASPATGLIGLQENELLGDFFGCLGFLSLASERLVALPESHKVIDFKRLVVFVPLKVAPRSYPIWLYSVADIAKTLYPLPPPPAYSTVRGGMMGVMLAGASRQYQYHPGAPSPSHISSGLVGEDAAGVRQATGKRSCADGGSVWSNALAAGPGSGALPRNTSTCSLWCAIALGALVRGMPMDHVGRGIPTLYALPPPAWREERPTSACFVVCAPDSLALCNVCITDSCMQPPTQHRFFSLGV